MTALMSGALVAGLLFIPLFLIAFYSTSPFRFGRFQADNTESVRFDQVRQYLPPNATEIDMITASNQHHVRFRISKSELTAWMNRLWDIAGQHSPMPRNEAAFGTASNGDDAPELIRLGMDPEAQYMLYEGPYQGDWGGPTLWYDPKTEVAWQDVGYW